MKIKRQDIFKILKTVLMVGLVIFCLTACQADNKEINMTSVETDGTIAQDEEELRENHRACWQGGILAMFYKVMGNAALTAYAPVTGGAMTVIMLGFAIWLSLRVLKHVSAVVEESPAEVWTEVTRMAFACLFCGILASSPQFLMYTLNTFIFPIYYTFLEFGSRIVELTAQDSQEVSGQMLGTGENETCLIYTNQLVCKAPPLEKISNDSFPEGPSIMMQCLACATSDRMQLGFTIAQRLLTESSITAAVAGIIIFAIFLIVKVAFVFYLVDSIFRMTIVIIILPFLILSMPFKVTRKWSKYGFQVIINSSANMMCLAVIMTMAMFAMQITVEENTEELGNPASFTELSIILLAMILIAFLVLKSCGLAITLADQLVGGGGGTNFQKKIAKLAAWVAKRAFELVSVGSGKAFTSVIDKIEVLREAREKAQKVQKKVQQTMNRLSGRDRQ